MDFAPLSRALDELLPQDDVPVVAYSGLWSIASAFQGSSRELLPVAQRLLLDAVGPHRTLLMPAYTSGFQEGVLDLDKAPGSTGLLNEAIRRMPGTRRTASAFFSFAARGPQADEVARLRPRDAWGAGSLFEWLEERDAHILLLGVPLPMCSFLHRLEWHARVPYRFPKDFSGLVRLDGREQELHERLFVRCLDPMVENVWPGAESHLGGSLQRRTVGRGEVATIRARTLLDKLMPVITRDPFSFVKNPDALRTHFAVKKNAESTR